MAGVTGAQPPALGLHRLKGRYWVLHWLPGKKKKKMLKGFEAGALPLEICSHAAGWLQSCVAAKLPTRCPGGPPSPRGSPFPLWALVRVPDP